MPLIRNDEHDVVYAVASLVDCNPFLPQRIALERRALGDAFVPAAAVWHAPGADGDLAAFNPNAAPLRQVVERLGADLRQRLLAGALATEEELGAYHRIVLYLLFQRYEDHWYNLIGPKGTCSPSVLVACYEEFARDVEYFFAGVPPARGESRDPARLFAFGFQARRAFHYIFRQIFGSSLAVARLRAAIWESIFTCNVRRYRRVLFRNMRDIPTLIIGASGTGKELVAQAIALSQFIPFDGETHTFAADPAVGFVRLNLAALSPTLIEAELFGHGLGAFTGAVKDRIGPFETCGPYGSVFLDEIGELDAAIQVKLLRLLQNREFQRVGETTMREFEGKIIAATNRDLERAITSGRFREDLYHRLWEDVISTPSLREQLADTPGELHHLVRIVAGRLIVSPDPEDMADEETEALIAEVQGWVHTHLGPDYAWPGNMRELEHCVSSINVHHQYQQRRALTDPVSEVAALMREATLTADELLERYCVIVHEQTGSYHETARLLGLDRRTVRTKVEAWTRRARKGTEE